MIVGSNAPGFTADALINGQMKSVSLSDYPGKWIILFFYSGDFSFV
jgi:alkyl hydroperoxide reductase subunit AhpC